MKHLFTIVCMVLVIILTGCGNSAASSSSQKTVEDVLQSRIEGEQELQNEAESNPDSLIYSQQTGNITMDLTDVSGAILYSEVYRIVMNPEDYVDETVKLKGIYHSSTDVETGKQTHICLVYDTTGCCSQSLPFQLSDGSGAPNEKAYITISGTITINDDHQTPLLTDVQFYHEP